MELPDSLTGLFIETAKTLTGSARRLCMARTVTELGPGGHRQAERDLGWNRGTIRTGMRELERGCICRDTCTARGRKRGEAPVPNLLTDLAAMVARPSQADPQVRSQRLYPRRAAAAVRRHLIAQQGATDDALPTGQPSTTTRNALDDDPHKVAQRQPKQRSPQPTPASTR